MWILKKQFTFEAAHRLPLHDGKCARLHGHSWKGWIECRGDMLNTSGSKMGMLIDYGTMKEAVEPLLEGYLDHYYLNETLELASPTSETIAKWIYDRLARFLPVTAVIIEETCTSQCEYRP